MTQLIIDHATLEQLVAALENHAGNYKLNKAESDVHRAAITAGRAALANAEQAECGNTPYDEGPFTIANAEPEEDQLIFNKGDMDKYLNAKGIKFVNASHLAIRYAKSKEHP